MFPIYVTGLWIAGEEFTLDKSKTKSILFLIQNRKKKVWTLGTNYSDIKIKQHSNVT